MPDFDFPVFDPAVDYFTCCLQFELKYGMDTLGGVVKDKDKIEEIYRAMKTNSIYTQEYWYKDMCLNMRRLRRLNQLSEFTEKFNSLNAVGAADSDFAFITIGWNPQEILPDVMLRLSLSIFRLKYFRSCDMVLEKYRANGEHYHTHFLVKFVDKYPPSKIIGWIFQTKGVKKYVLGKQFIDYKGSGKKVSCADYVTYHNYVRGIKKPEKMPYVEKDRQWREECMIQHLYER